MKKFLIIFHENLMFKIVSIRRRSYSNEGKKLFLKYFCNQNNINDPPEARWYQLQTWLAVLNSVILNTSLMNI